MVGYGYYCDVLCDLLQQQDLGTYEIDQITLFNFLRN